MSPSGLEDVRRLARQAGSSFYPAFVFLPRERFEAIVTIYAWCRRSDDIVDGAGSVEERRAALAAWRAALGGAFQPDPAGIREPILRALWQVLRRFPVPRERFEELLDGVGMDLDRSRYSTAAELEDYAYRVASVVGLMSIEVFGYRDPGARDYAVALGKALQLTNILRDVRGDLEAGRIYLPLEDLAAEPGALLDLEAGRDSDALARAAARTGARARGFFAAARRLLPAADRRSLFPAEIMRRVYERVFARLERRGFHVLGPRVRVSRPVKAAIALGEWLASRLASGAR